MTWRRTGCGDLARRILLVLWLGVCITLGGGPGFASGGSVVGPDASGYRLVDSDVAGGPEYVWEDISQTGVNLVAQSSDLDEDTRVLTMPFDFTFYGIDVDTVHVAINGVVHFNDLAVFRWNSMKCMPYSFGPGLPQEGVLAVLWADLLVDTRVGAGLFYVVRGQAPNRRMILQWHNLRDLQSSSGYVSFQAVFYEATGDILMHYKDLEVSLPSGSVQASAHIGAQGDPNTAGGVSYMCGTRDMGNLKSLLLTKRWDVDDDGVNRLTDCDDVDDTVYPGAREICDTQDNDCDGDIDEDYATEGSAFFPDGDHDGYGAGASQLACVAPAGYAAQNGDCDDSAAASYPGATEYCDGADNDCDGQIDDNAADANTYYLDSDADGFGDSTIPAIMRCAPPPGLSVAGISGDCNDENENIFPGATEICNGRDDDCNGAADDDPIDPTIYYQDGDGDGYGLTNKTLSACIPPSGYASESGDCNDQDAAVNPGRSEVCNRKDDDCSGTVDDNATDGEPHYPDADGDAFPGKNGEILACTDFPPAGYILPIPSGASFLWDCDDGNGSVYPGATEICNGIDDDCDQRRDEGYDLDGDTIVDCEDDCPADPNNDSDEDGFCANADNCPEVYNPDQADTNRDGTGDVCTPESCDGIDNDGDGSADEGFADTDGDGAADCVDLLCLEDPLNDDDGDLICGMDDNCPDVANEGQEDVDEDGIGDACDACPETSDDGADGDGDGWPDACDVCPALPDSEQADSDGDGIGDRCEDCALEEGPDGDDDGFPDHCDVCPDDADDQADGDLDGVGDLCDVCPDTFNNSDDTDGDGWPDDCDVCPEDADPEQSDADGDGVGDACSETPTPTETETPTSSQGVTPTPSLPTPTATEPGSPSGTATPTSTFTPGEETPPPSCGSCASSSEGSAGAMALLLLFCLPFLRPRRP